MANKIIYIGGSETVTVPATESIAVSNFGGGVAKIYYWIVAANVPDDWQYQQSIENEEVVLGPFSVAQLVRIDAGTSKVLFDIGASPATGTPASTLGGLTAAQFVRSDASDDLTGTDYNLDNQTFINGRDTGATERDLIGVDGSDISQVGSSALPTNINSDGTLTHNNNPILDSTTLLAENILINSTFEINQRGAVSGANLSLVGDYFLDRWCAGTADSAPTWTGGVVTIPAGDSIKQIVEDVNIPDGTYTLSWTGTSTASIDGGASQTSPHTFTVSSGTHVEVEFEEGTVSQPNLVPGSNEMAWYRKNYGYELCNCSRYYSKSYDYSDAPGTSTEVGAVELRAGRAVASINVSSNFTTTMATVPDVVMYTQGGASGSINNASAATTPTVTLIAASTKKIYRFTISAAPAADDTLYYQFTADAEL